LVFDKLTDTYGKLRDSKLVLPEDEVGKALAGLFDDLMKGIEEMQDDARVALIVDGAAIPWSEGLAVEISGCINCTTASHDQVQHDMLPGVWEDAGMDTCIKHGLRVTEWMRAHQHNIPEGEPSVLEIAHMARSLGTEFAGLEKMIRSGRWDSRELRDYCGLLFANDN
jgi:hypothetical protein